MHPALIIGIVALPCVLVFALGFVLGWVAGKD
jgi:hypothetical protein